jgi:hypothetical protein
MIFKPITIRNLSVKLGICIAHIYCKMTEMGYKMT